jgi:hypothetical protein
MDKKRGAGIYIFGVCGILLNVGVLIFIFSSPGSLIPKDHNPALLALNIAFAILPIAGLAASIGVFMLKNWARIVFMVESVIFLFISGASFLFVILSGQANLKGLLMGTSIGILPFIAVIIYFTRPKVKALFVPVKAV